MSKLEQSAINAQHQSSSAPSSSTWSKAAEPQNAPMGHNEQDDEWEYEYDTNETEHFYVTLDLTSRVPPQQRRRRTSISDSDPATDDPPVLSNPDSIQILDLHTDNPLIAHQHKLYSCHWASAVGTDLLFTLPTETPSPVVPVAPELEQATASTSTSTPQPSAPPLRKTADYSILAATPHRLVCVPAVRNPKLDGDDGPSLTDRPQRLHENNQRTAQATFLQQLADLKVQKGQTDKVPMHASNSADRPRTIIRPLLPSAAVSQARATATNASLSPSTVHSPAQGQQSQHEDVDADDDVDIDVDDTEDVTQGPITSETLPHVNLAHSPNEPATSPGNTPEAQLPDSTAGPRTPASIRRGSARGRGGRPSRRAPQALARDNIIGGLVGDVVADKAPHLMRAFEESIGYEGLRPKEKRGVQKGGRMRGSGKGGARVGGRRRSSRSTPGGDLHEGEDETQDTEMDQDEGEAGPSTRAPDGDADIDMSDA